MPELHIITGSNGAGKSSVGADHLPPHIVKACGIFDGDKLTLQKIKELKSKRGIGYKDAKVEANEWIPKHFNRQIAHAIKSAHHFAYEGHFRNESAWKTIDKFRIKGYTIHMVFFGLVNVERSAMRVLERALSGGHNVSQAEIDLNFHGNLLQLDRHFLMLDDLRILDTSETIPKVLFQMSNKKVDFCLPLSQLPDWFTNYLINITRLAYPDI